MLLGHVEYWRGNCRSGDERQAFYHRHKFDPKLIAAVEAEMPILVAATAIFVAVFLAAVLPLQ
jgi:hypothetical protein